jgi:hypothetical protein
VIDDVDSDDQEMQDLEQRQPAKKTVSQGRTKDVEMHDHISDVDSD